MTLSLSSFYAIVSSTIFVSYWLLIVITTLRIITRRRPTSYIMSWLLLIYIIPFIGVILYFLFGEIYLGKSRMRRSTKQHEHIIRYLHSIYQHPSILTSRVSPVAKPLFQLCKYQTGLPGISGNKIALFSESADVFDRMIYDIDHATISIKMVFYIWKPGGRVDTVTEALKRAVKRGVKVHLMLDSAGSRHFFHSDSPRELEAAGITIVETLKVNLLRFLFRRLDLRQHRKMILIDNQITYIGSMNMVDPRYFKKYKDVGKWVDLMIRIDGPITLLANVIYTSDWALETNQFLELPLIKKNGEIQGEHNPILQMVPSGPGYTENMIHQILLNSIYTAQKQLILTSPYFVPSDDIIHALCAASQRGVDVNIIVPAKNDSVMVKWASRAFYTELLLGRVKIYEFQSNLLHSKSVLIDSQVSLIGTVNLDMRSLWLNFEITTVIDDHDFSEKLSDLLAHYMKKSHKVELQDWQNRPIWHPIVERFFSFFSPLL